MGWFRNDWQNLLDNAVDDERPNVYNVSLLIALSITVYGLGRRRYETHQEGGGGQVSAGTGGGTGGGGGGNLGVWNQDFLNGAFAATLLGGTTLGGYMMSTWVLSLAGMAASSTPAATADYMWMKAHDTADLALQLGQDIPQELSQIIDEAASM